MECKNCEKKIETPVGLNTLCKVCRKRAIENEHKRFIICKVFEQTSNGQRMVNVPKACDIKKGDYVQLVKIVAPVEGNLTINTGR